MNRRKKDAQHKCFHVASLADKISPMSVTLRLALLADSQRPSANSEGEESGTIDSQDGRGWKEAILPVLVIALTAKGPLGFDAT